MGRRERRPSGETVSAGPELGRQEVPVEEIFVTRLWMAGVVTAMVVFGIAALIGYVRKSKTENAGKR